jgi:hypothetical protein
MTGPAIDARRGRGRLPLRFIRLVVAGVIALGTPPICGASEAAPPPSVAKKAAATPAARPAAAAPLPVRRPVPPCSPRYAATRGGDDTTACLPRR